MNKEKVYIEGYEVDTRVSPLGYLEKKIQLMNGEFVIVDENFIHKSIEPQPVKVPQFVADFIAEQKKLGHTLSYSIDASMSDIVAEWYWDNSELFARAWLDGYKVEEEKRYLVKIKATKHYFVKDGNGKIFFSLAFKGCFTKKQLEDADLGWVFDCPGIELEEVE